jgi:hypothetical protein
MQTRVHTMSTTSGQHASRAMRGHKSVSFGGYFGCRIVFALSAPQERNNAARDVSPGSRSLNWVGHGFSRAAQIARCLPAPQGATPGTPPRQSSQSLPPLSSRASRGRRPSPERSRRGRIPIRLRIGIRSRGTCFLFSEWEIRKENPALETTVESQVSKTVRPGHPGNSGAPTSS